MKGLFLSLVLVVAPLVAQDPVVETVVLPDCGQTVPVNAPPLVVGGVYAFEADKDVLVFTSPPGLVTVSKEAGPMKIRGVFYGNKQVSTQMFKKRWVYQLDVVPGAKGRVELIVVPVGATTEKMAARKLLDVDGGTPPNPGPGPGPNPGPGPTPDPTPVPADVKMTHVVLVEETEAAQRERAAFLSDPAFAQRRKERGIGLRTADKDTKDANGNTPADLIEFIQKSAGKGYPQVFFVGYDKNGKRTTLYQGDLPKTSAEFLQLMSKYGG